MEVDQGVGRVIGAIAGGRRGGLGGCAGVWRKGLELNKKKETTVISLFSPT